MVGKTSVQALGTVQMRHVTGVANMVEEKSGPWWEKFEEAKLYFQSEGRWPQGNHPTLGHWARTVNLALQKRNKRVSGWEGTGDYAITADRDLALRQAGYTANGRGCRVLKQGRVATILAYLQKGESLSPPDKSYLRTRYNSGALGESTYKQLIQLGATL